jgi:hypothetical protein
MLLATVKLGKCFLDVVGHGHVDGSCGVVPNESEAAVEIAFPIGDECRVAAGC